MSNLYLPSSQVEVFPSAKRANQSSDYKASRLVGEKSNIDSIRHVVSHSSYVITKTFTLGSSFEFILNGYYFDIQITDLTAFNSSSSIYAAITLSTVDSDFPELEGVDESGLYKGLVLTDSPDSPQVYLKILQKSNGSWSIPSDSRYKFDYDDINITDDDIIDCGVVSI